ncbi:Protein NO VEIN (Protein EMBRYO DEFECTIVE 2597) [Durusdinium trenchii]|uniref:Protein NO VEIN (Protein EMBRYO DEFECTIVE 2597) n=1 Tax=Durusdinium trenchii TaxID=1381693 RepID=A0ABP0HSK1_9DINO
MECGLIHLAAHCAGILVQLLCYGPSTWEMATLGEDLQDIQSLIVKLTEAVSDNLDGSREALSMATAYLSALAWSMQWRHSEASSTPSLPAVPDPPGPPEPTQSTEAVAPLPLPRAEVEDPALGVLKLVDIQKQLDEEMQQRRAAEEALHVKETELQSAKLTMGKLMDEKKDLAQRISDLESELLRAQSSNHLAQPKSSFERRLENLPASEGSDDVEESDWVLKADPETLSMSDAEGFISRIAARRDSVKILRSSLCGGLRQLGEQLYTSPVHFIDELLQNADDCSYGSEEPTFKIDATQSSATFTYNERGFRACDVLSLCSLAVSTKSGGDFLGHKGVGFKSVFACSHAPAIISGKFRFKFEVPGVDELSYITPRWLDVVPGRSAEGTVPGTQIILPFRPELANNEDFLQKLHAAIDPLVLLGLRRLRRLSFQMDGEPQVTARLTKTEANWQLTTSREAVRESLENYQLRSQAPDKLGASDQPGMSRTLGDWMPFVQPVTRNRLLHVGAGPGTPPLWQSFAEEVLHEIRLALPDLAFAGCLG